MTTNPHGPGAGPAGRRLLSDIDRHSGDADEAVQALAAGRYWRLEGRGHTYARATIRRLEDVGLIVTEVGAHPDGDALVIRLTPQGRALLGA